MIGTGGLVGVLVTAVVMAAIAAIGFVAGVGMYFARRIVTPSRTVEDDVQIIAVDGNCSADTNKAGPTRRTITLRRTAETIIDGRYGLWLNGGAGHARLGAVLEVNDQVVVRQLAAMEFVDRGDLNGPTGNADQVPQLNSSARWNQYYYAGTPAQNVGITHHEVTLNGPLGPMPAWHIPVADDVVVCPDVVVGPDVVMGPASNSATDSAAVRDATVPESAVDAWAILVHGRGATREECIRAIAPIHRLGMAMLVPSYRNDLDAPAAPDRRYHLGDTEWQDIEVAMQWAIDHGARRLVLVGWSMGGATVLQAAHRSSLTHHVVAIILDAPVLDWRSVMDHHGAIHRIPSLVNRIGQRMLRNRVGCRLIGLDTVLDIRGLDWVTRATELRHPMLIIHSEADEYVPSRPSIAIAQARPDLIHLEPWGQGRHTKEWNTDPQRWERVVTDFLTRWVRS